MAVKSREKADSFTDKMGQEVRVGDRIVYGSALGRCAALRFGKVLKIERLDLEYRLDPVGWSIQVQGIDDSALHCYPLALCKTTGNLQFPDRIVKVPTLPPEYEALLSA